MVDGGIVRETIYDDSNGRLVVAMHQNVDEILAGIERDRDNLDADKTTRKSRPCRRLWSRI